MHDLDRRLRSARRHVAWADGLRHAAILCACAAGVVALAFLIDARWPLPGMIRFMIDLVFVGLVVAAGMTIPFTLGRANHLDLRRVARLAEREASIPHSAIINAVDLGDRLAADTTSHDLVQRAIQLGEDAAPDVHPARIATWARTRRAGACALTLVAATLLLLTLMPRLWAYEWPRFRDPSGHDPPFTWLDFTISTTPGLDAVRVGDDVRVSADVAGSTEAVERAFVLLLDDAHQVVDRQPMDRARDTGFEHTLPEVREPVRIAIETDRGRSLAVDIVPDPTPRIERAHAVTIDPPYARTEPRVQVDLDHVLTSVSRGETRITIESNVPLRTADVESTLAATIAVDPNVAQTVTVTLPSDRLGTHEATVRLVGLDGTRGDETLRLRLDVLPDQPPVVDLAESERELVAHTEQRLPLRLDASDDLGLASVDIVIDVESAGGHQRRIESRIATNPGRTSSRVAEIDLAAMDLRAGDRISARFKGVDNRVEPYGSPQTDLSERISVLVVDPSTYTQAQAFLSQKRQAEAQGPPSPTIDIAPGDDASPEDDPNADPGDYRAEGDVETQSTQDASPAADAVASNEPGGRGRETDATESVVEPSPDPAQTDDSATDDAALALDLEQLESLLSGRTLAGDPFADGPPRDGEAGTISGDEASRSPVIVEETALIGSMSRVASGVSGSSLRHVPSVYRSVVARYFERVARDAAPSRTSTEGDR